MKTGRNKRGVRNRAATQTSRLEDEESLAAPVIINVHVQEVFACDLLLEMILDYAMRNENGDLCTGNIRKLRLVQKSWNKAVSSKLGKNKEPLFRLKLNASNSLLRFVKGRGKLLDQFVKYWNTKIKTKEVDAMPTFRIQLEQEYFRHENYQSLLTCLDKCGKGLLEIEMDLPENCAIPGILRNVSLPNLTKLTMNLTGDRLEIARVDVAVAEVVDNPSNITFLFQSLLTGNESLRTLALTCGNWDKLYLFPLVQYTKLPSTLTSLEINFSGAERILGLLTSNELPKLRSLTLGINCETPDALAKSLEGIFEKVKETLQSLSLYGGNYGGPPRLPILLQFPVMENLQKLEIQRLYFELKNEIPAMEELFPKLEKLLLYDQTPKMLEKWTKGSPCTLVDELALELVDESKPRIPWNTLSLTLEAIQSAHKTFPNVCNLSVDICGTEISCLRYIFGEMRQLTSLHITVVEGASFRNSNHWDSILTGVPLDLVANLATFPQHWKYIAELNNLQPSIRMLKELTTFSLKEADVFDVPPEADLMGNPLISDLAFLYGFLKMPKLICLTFKGRFRASEEMNNEWKERGQEINYQNEESGSE